MDSSMFYGNKASTSSVQDYREESSEDDANFASSDSEFEMRK